MIQATLVKAHIKPDWQLLGFSPPLQFSMALKSQVQSAPVFIHTKPNGMQVICTFTTILKMEYIWIIHQLISMAQLSKTIAYLGFICWIISILIWKTSPYNTTAFPALQMKRKQAFSSTAQRRYHIHNSTLCVLPVR